jgi:lipid II:glycine glycyltransferase (peptidoglycan interpeptide bridge formation enzyme)
MTLLYQPYITQTAQWAEFWREAVGDNHQYHHLIKQIGSIEISAFVYQYPWHFHQTFLYVPRGPIISYSSKKPSQSELTNALSIFTTELAQLAKLQTCTFIKWDGAYQLSTLLSLEHSEDFLESISQSLSPNGQSTYIKTTSEISTKSLQYLSTMILDTTGIIPNTADNYQDLYSQNTLFWSKTNENIRRYTKKSLNSGWVVDKEMSSENFEKFWSIYQLTASKHKFGTHSKSYFETFIAQSFARIITLSDENGVQSVWLGAELNGVLYYLYGGNTEISFKKYGQYFIHLVATQMCGQHSIHSYDLGGYDGSKGFGKFKEGYRGNIITFLGPIDIILHQQKFTLTRKFVNAAKNVSSVIRFW